jgi:uncharacterized protein YjbI with pentapeptide repeats
MADEEHLAILRRGVQAWNAWRAERDDMVPDLIGADLAGADLGGVHLSQGRLSKALLGGVYLGGPTWERPT